MNYNQAIALMKSYLETRREENDEFSLMIEMKNGDTPPEIVEANSVIVTHCFG